MEGRPQWGLRRCSEIEAGPRAALASGAVQGLCLELCGAAVALVLGGGGGRLLSGLQVGQRQTPQSVCIGIYCHVICMGFALLWALFI